MPQWPFKTLDPQLVAQLYDDYHEGVFILDREGRIVYYNKLMAQMDGLVQMDVPGRKFVDIYNLTEKNSVSLACLANQAPVKNRGVFYRTRLGTLVNAYCNSYPFFEDGRLAGALCFSLDFNLASTALEDLTRNYRAQSAPAPKEMAEAGLSAPHTFEKLIGRSESFLEAVEKAKLAAGHDLSIMLVGETGSGKELFAQAIHNHRPARARRFMAVNCPAIPDNLLESLLFGTTKGAFTGAMDKAGVFEAAAGGTIFLDEINSMSITLQSKLLRVLQERKTSRVGSTREVDFDCRVISATSQNPYSEISAQRLRQDLFYRLGAILIYVPPLRSRADDIPILCEHFIQKYRQRLRSGARGLTPEALEWLKRKPWPGNVRELEHAVASAMLFAKDEPYLKIEDFNTQEHFLSPGQQFGDLPAADPGFVEDHSEEWEMPAGHLENKRLNDEREKSRIVRALEKTGGHKAAAAALLGLSPQLLHSKLKKYDLNRPSPTAPTAEHERMDLARALEDMDGNKSAAAALLGMSRQSFHAKLKKYGLDGGRR